MSQLYRVVEKVDPIGLRAKDLEFLEKTFGDVVVVILRFNRDNSKIKRMVVHRKTHMSMLMYSVRKDLNVKASEGLAFLVETYGGANIQLPGTMTISDVNDTYSHPDGFVYINVIKESVFG